MMTFFHSPGSCSNGILFLLHEVGAAFECVVVDLRKGEQTQAAYRALNPKGKVPALRLSEGSVLTEFQAIATWLTAAHPEAGLQPANELARSRVIEALDFIIGSVHMRGFTFVKVPAKFHDSPEAQTAIRAHGRKEVTKGLSLLSEHLGEQDYLLGEFSAADAGLFYVLTWAEEEGFGLPRNLGACLARLRARPAYAAAGPMLRHQTAASTQ
ncbi:MAG: glutathione S-transferase N-terminal domain-containing protein [Alphaproteobacteria bacterium]|uniref:Glutathione S-transferase n=1 Tax=Celeribacter baekdonensis TaxID=875171 RepID=A0A1G7U2P0_9RHOB|nr:glutathione S-transferase N-terminal domain-containing protein [Celeribacter baekdonensis]MBU0643219.1 glutathione S-transferase N-terminal domain-containing protein [Alphaproteobacteria bacterium]MBU1281421.1 glutathione S-transferase N-terminal domain-containing protein [Alphaproteobacteria bacterium]MBU1571707.1 glutathione S-transferase N-terminal domain-containing protein [Alphaproteobacteria bacterium]MBU1828069.1 glutathione S-transferase N-terminal domain-containing protein [Alphapro